jgi:murein DD-endopeptidase MepM/ murein hydrolase activator NlpD
MKHLRAFAPILFLLASGCISEAHNSAGTQPALPTFNSNTASQTAAHTPESTAFFPTETLTQFPVTEAPPPLPTATSGAMQLFFPTVIPAEGAEYRPPLYPVPWAISPFDHFYFAAPIAATYPGDPEWDYRYGGVFFGPDIIHTGIDLPAPRGTDILAAASGTVVWAGLGLYTGSPYSLNDPYGLAVAIRHDFGYQNQELYTVYAHMDEIEVVIGQKVNTGEAIGKVGSTGNTTGPHLHFEVRLGENSFFATRNPELWIAPPQGYGVLAGRVMADYGTTLKNYLVTLRDLETDKKWLVYTYASDTTIHSDSYYNENLVLGGLPAGIYELNIQYAGLNRIVEIQILPGQVTYFQFFGFSGYNFSEPAAPTAGPIVPEIP